MSALSEAEKSRLKRLRQTPEQKEHNRKVSLRWFAANRKVIAEKRRMRRISDPEGHAKHLAARRANAYSTWPPEKKAAFLAEQKRRYANRSPAKRLRDKAYRDKRYAAQQKQRTADARKRWQNDPAWKAKKLVESRLYYVKNRERALARSKAYAAKNRGRVRCVQAKYRALKRQAAVNLRGIKDFVLSVKSKPFATCYYCNSRTPTDKIHFDHVVPLSKGGPHSVENLCVSCGFCNMSKHDKTVADWMKTRIGQHALNL